MRGALAWTALALIAGCNGRDESAPSANQAAAPSAPAAAPQVEVIKVVSKPLDTATHLEGELAPYERVALFARASGFVQNVLVDRGSRVKKGEVLLTVVAPELGAQRAEAQAKLEGDKSTHERLTAASQTPGAVAGQEVELARAAVQADQARVDSLRALEQYLTVTAPFEGTIIERNVHPGALVGPQGGANQQPMLRLEQVSKLRLTVPVPESLAGAIAEGAPATFAVRAFPGVKFNGVTARIAHSVDAATRSMPVELDVDNGDGRLAPGMFADVLWPVKRSGPSLFVPPSAIVQSTERTFVVRINDGTAEQVPVQRGTSQGELVEVFGAIQDGDIIARRGTEELRNGMHVETHDPKPAGSSP
jgi:membrane fusion protein (multidrug efflux system)